jgi:hypothetical protein
LVIDFKMTGWLRTVVVSANGFRSWGSRWTAERTRIRTSTATIAATIPPTLGMRGMVFLGYCAVGWLRSFTSH